MAVELEPTPKSKRAPGERCREPVAYPEVEHDQAIRIVATAKALGDPVRVRLVDVLKSTPGRCACVSSCRCLTSPLPAQRLSPPEGSAPGRDRRLRARGAAGLLLRPPRRLEGAFRMAEVTETTDIRVRP